LMPMMNARLFLVTWAMPENSRLTGSSGITRPGHGHQLHDFRFAEDISRTAHCVWMISATSRRSSGVNTLFFRSISRALSRYRLA
jgi:hypothetical protein